MTPERQHHPAAARRARRRARRDLRQAAHHHARGRARPRAPGARERPRVLPDPQLHRLPDGPARPRDGAGRRARRDPPAPRRVHPGPPRRRRPRPTATRPPTGASTRRRAPPSLVLGDIGTHAHHLACFVTGLELAAVAAEVGSALPGRQVDDFAHLLLRFAGPARGSMWVTNSAAGAEHGLHIRVFGDEGGLEWHQEDPNHLLHRPQRRLHAGPDPRPAGAEPRGRARDPRRARPPGGLLRGLRQPLRRCRRGDRRAPHRRARRTRWRSTSRPSRTARAASASSRRRSNRARADGRWTDCRLAL